ncbi:MAG TPA: hypothetical protein EYP16_02055 [Candidatus Atribacteria bacterium]|nr:hypothetical protein [Candidatus Atribacteria bacterium]
MIYGKKNYIKLYSCHEEKKRCPRCGSLETKKNGYINSQVNTKRGKVKRKTQRFRCKECGCSFTSHGFNQRISNSEEIKIMAVKDYILSKNSLSEVAKRYGISKKSILNWMREKSGKVPNIEDIEMKREDCSGVILVDTTEIKVKGHKKNIYVASDAYTGIPIYYEEYDSENRENSLDFFGKVKRFYPVDIKGITSDFGKGKCFVNVIKEMFPNIPHQICLVHYKRYLCLFLPKTRRSKYFWRNKVIKYLIHKMIDAPNRKKSLYWYEKFISWIPFFKASYHKRFIRSVIKTTSGLLKDMIIAFCLKPIMLLRT